MRASEEIDTTHVDPERPAIGLCCVKGVDIRPVLVLIVADPDVSIGSASQLGLPCKGPARAQIREGVDGLASCR